MNKQVFLDLQRHMLTHNHLRGTIVLWLNELVRPYQTDQSPLDPYVTTWQYSGFICRVGCFQGYCIASIKKTSLMLPHYLSRVLQQYRHLPLFLFLLLRQYPHR